MPMWYSCAQSGWPSPQNCRTFGTRPRSNGFLNPLPPASTPPRYAYRLRKIHIWPSGTCAATVSECSTVLRDQVRPCSTAALQFTSISKHCQLLLCRTLPGSHRACLLASGGCQDCCRCNQILVLLAVPHQHTPLLSACILHAGIRSSPAGQKLCHCEVAPYADKGPCHQEEVPNGQTCLQA